MSDIKPEHMCTSTDMIIKEKSNINLKPLKDSSQSRRHKQKVQAPALGAKMDEMSSDEDAPVDTTEILPLRSRKTERLQKRIQKKTQKHIGSQVKTLLDLPSELLLATLGFLRPSDVFALLRVSHPMRDFIRQNEKQISQATIRLRYPILKKCFPLPVRLDQVEKSAHAAILSPKHQQRLLIHKRPYQHIKSADPEKTCSCISCVLAWNNLNLLVDLSHWQGHAERREIIPTISRGSQPQWNTDLVTAYASYVDNAITHPLWYARLLEKHLDTTVRIIVRHSIIRHPKRPLDQPVSDRLYHLCPNDIDSETDDFLNRSAPPCFEFPYQRDNYYFLKQYLPNRRWDSGKWIYYGDLHDTDLAWTKHIAEKELTQLGEQNYPSTTEPRLATAEGAA